MLNAKINAGPNVLIGELTLWLMGHCIRIKCASHHLNFGCTKWDFILNNLQKQLNLSFNAYQCFWVLRFILFILFLWPSVHVMQKQIFCLFVTYNYGLQWKQIFCLFCTLDGPKLPTVVVIWIFNIQLKRCHASDTIYCICYFPLVEWNEISGKCFSYTALGALE